MVMLNKLPAPAHQVVLRMCVYMFTVLIQHSSWSLPVQSIIEASSSGSSLDKTRHTGAALQEELTMEYNYTATPKGIANIHVCIISIIRDIRQGFRTLVLFIILLLVLLTMLISLPNCVVACSVRVVTLTYKPSA